MPRRAGVTLIEVLVAIFIMGVGLLALLVLFPVGALNMARAVRDDRAAQAGANAAAVARAADVGNDATVRPLLAATPPGGFAAPDPAGAGYPVYCDPWGVGLGAGDLAPGVQRCGVSFASTPTDKGRWFCLLDEMNFQPNGKPVNEGSAGSLERPGTFTWAYLLRRTRAGDPALRNVAGLGFTEAPLVDVTVVVYASRNLGTVGGETVVTSASTALGSAGQTEIALPSGQQTNLKKGGWVFDATYNATAAGGSINGYFYQLDAVELDPSTNQVRLTIQGALRADVRTLVLMENVIAVFEKGVGWKP